MTVSELVQKTGFAVLSAGDMEREISGEYCCDLLSVVMSTAFEGCAWVTVITNINAAAVASLVDMSCIILAGSAAADEKMIERSRGEGITVLKSGEPVFETALAVRTARLTD